MTAKHYAGIDPGIGSAAICIVDERAQALQYEVVQTRRQDYLDNVERVGVIVERFIALLNTYAVSHLALERQSYCSTGNNTRDLGGFYFLMRYLLRQQACACQVEMVSPTTLKKFVTGYGGTRKGHNTKTALMQELPPTFDAIVAGQSSAKKREDLTDAYWLSRYAHAYYSEPPAVSRLPQGAGLAPVVASAASRSSSPARA